MQTGIISALNLKYSQLLKRPGNVFKNGPEKLLITFKKCENGEVTYGD